jgi:hypothetical protein
MNEDRWRRIEELYHAARLLNESARASFLAAATDGDEELRHEVESLIVSGASSPGFLDEPVQTTAAAARVVDASSLTGKRIGAYSVHERIGAGGMGEVYRAHDSRLHRDVALKVLAADLIADRAAAEEGAALKALRLAERDLTDDEIVDLMVKRTRSDSAADCRERRTRGPRASSGATQRNPRATPGRSSPCAG